MESDVEQLGVIECDLCEGQAMLMSAEHLYYECKACEHKFTTKTLDVINYLVDKTYDYFLRKE